MKTKAILFLMILIVVVASSLWAKSSLLVFLTDLYNQISIKPQEEGSIIEVPIGTVSVKGVENEDLNARFNWLENEISEKTTTKNPVKPTKSSLANGKQKYLTYCAVCHSTTREINEEGFAKTKVNELGMLAPAVIRLTHNFTDGYIFQKIKYGGSVMPSLGFALTEKDRWDIVNFIRTLERAR